MVQLTNYSLITEFAVATSADQHICNLLFTRSLHGWSPVNFVFSSYHLTCTTLLNSEDLCIIGKEEKKKMMHERCRLCNKFWVHFAEYHLSNSNSSNSESLNSTF